MRRLRTIQRREYHVNGPLALWHIDGNHKLIRWRLVIHGGVDGYSRTVVFLQCSDNNKVDTVFRSFSTAVQSYGLPSRIRSDRGGENVLVANYMLQHPERGPGRGLFITGRSVHNSRDVFRGCTCLFYNLFYHLEEVELLDVDDKFSLHYVYLPKIRKSLEAFKCSWNSHLMSSERGLSPTQQWMRGLALFQGEVAQLSIAEAPLYDIDWNAPFSEEDDAQCVEVPHTLNPLTPADFIELCQEINPSNSNFTASNYGIDEYCATVQFVRAKVINY